MHNLPSLFYCGFEKAAKANDIMLTLRFKQPLDLAKCWFAYQHLFSQHKALRATYRYDPLTKRYAWSMFDVSELSPLLLHEKQEQTRFHTAADVYSCFYPTGASLPIRVRAIDSHTAVFLVSHVFGDGRTTFAWLNEWCRCYEIATPTNTVVPVQTTHDIPSVWNNPGTPANMSALMRAGIVHFAKLGLASLLALRKRSVDLSHNRMPRVDMTGSHVVNYHFSVVESEHILQAAHAASLSTAGYIHRALCAALFELYPNCSMQKFGIASDVSKSFPQADALAPGCLINPYLALVVRDQPLVAQIQRIYEEARAGAPVALLALSSKLVPSHRFVERHVYRTTLKPANKRQWLERLSFIYSHVRDPQHAFTSRCVESISGHTKSQTAFVASTIINGHLSLEICTTHMVFDPVEIERWFATVKRSLLDNRFAY